MSRTLVMVNPAAGGGRARRVWDRTLAGPVAAAGAKPIDAPSAEASISALDMALAEGDVGRVLAVGGDGTAHLVANRLLAGGHGADVALGIVPAGTGSDLARFLGLPRHPADALRHALEAEPRPVDAIAVDLPDGDERRYALNVVSAGLSGEVGRLANAGPKRRSTYLVATLRTLLRYTPVVCRVSVDGEPLYAGAPFLVAVANSQYFGRGMRVAPAARLDDGELDIIVVPPLPLVTLPYRLPQFLVGRHVRWPGVLTARGRRVELEPGEGFPPLDLDGESVPASPAVFTVLPKALRLIG